MTSNSLGDGGVSLAVLVGAVVGTLVGNTLLLVSLFLCYRWRRRRRGDAEGASMVRRAVMLCIFLVNRELSS
jgi:hypothetical protein